MSWLFGEGRAVAVFIFAGCECRFIRLRSISRALISLWPLSLSELTLRLQLLLSAATPVLARLLRLPVSGAIVLTRILSLPAATALFLALLPSLAAIASTSLAVFLRRGFALLWLRECNGRHQDEGR